MNGEDQQDDADERDDEVGELRPKHCWRILSEDTEKYTEDTEGGRKCDAARPATSQIFRSGRRADRDSAENSAARHMLDRVGWIMTIQLLVS